MPRRTGRAFWLPFALGGLFVTCGCSSGGGAADAGSDAGPDGAYRWHAFYDVYNSNGGDLIAADPSGNAYLTGVSGPWDGPNGEPPVDAYSAESWASVVVKVGADGAYLWHTFWGPDSAIASVIAVDAGGGVCVAGKTYGSWEGPNGESPVSPYPSSGDSAIFLLRLDSEGAYAWHTFFGSEVASTEDTDGVASIAVVGGGDVVVVGRSMPWVGPDGEAPLHAHADENPFDANVFALRLGPDGAYRWHTFYPFRYGRGAAGAGGDIYVSGNSGSWNGPSGESPIDDLPEPGYGEDGFVVLKLDADGGYAWHTFHGPSAVEYGIAAGGDGALVAGWAQFPWDGPNGEGPLHGFAGTGEEQPDGGMGCGDGFVLALDASGAYRWHTFYGSEGGQDVATSIALGEGGDFYVTMAADHSWDGPSGEGPLYPYAGSFEAAVLALRVGGEYAWHAFFGSEEGWDSPTGSCFAGGALLVAGESEGPWDGPNGAGPLHGFAEEDGGSGSGSDTFVLRLVP